MPTNPATAIKYLLLLIGLMVMGLLFFAPKERAHGQEPTTTLDRGSFTIVQDTNPEDPRRDHVFRYEVRRDGVLLETLRLYDDDTSGSRFLLMEPGEYTVRQRSHDGYDAPEIECRGTWSERVFDDGTRFELAAGDSIRCTFTNESSPTPTPTRTATASPTPAPSSTSAPAAPQQIIVVREVVQPTAVPAAPVATPVQPVRIVPPSTGSAGLLR